MNQTCIPELVAVSSELRISDANEATTRFKLIDAILIDLLGWLKSDIKVEDRISKDGKSKYVDYIVTAGAHSFLIEAKRIGKFQSKLPEFRKGRLTDGWAKKEDLKYAISQAQEYAREKSVGFCVITDGLNWVVYPVNRRDQVPVQNSLAVIFADVKFSESDTVREFGELLSRQAVIEGSLDRQIFGSERDQIDSRRLNNLYDRSFSRSRRKSIFPAVEREIVTAFSEDLLSENKELLQKCYVETPERTRFDARIQMFVNRRDQVLKTRPIKPVGRKGDRSQIVDLITTRLSTRSIVLLTIGLVGAGKTTFLNYISSISAKNHFDISKNKPKGCWIHVDFRNDSIADDPKSTIIDSVFEYVRNHPYLNDYQKTIQHAYHSDIRSLRTGPLSLIAESAADFNQAVTKLIVGDYEKKAPYAEKILVHTATYCPIFLVIDNVDQIESVEKQSRVFLEAIAIARRLRCNLVLAMRDITYINNRTSAVFDAFDFDAAYIDAPDIQAVLAKRFVVAGQLLKGKTLDLGENGGPRVVVRDASVIVDMLVSSVLGTEVGRIIDVAATGDTRLALKMTRQFLQYGYTSTAKGLQIYQRTGKYQLPPHEALKAIMLGNQHVYREKLSAIGNPFDSYIGRSSVQFLRIFLMSALVLCASQNEFDGMAASELYDHLENIGVSRRDAQTVLADLIALRYVFTRSHQQLSEDAVIVPTRLSGFVVRDLAGRLAFLETVIFDTFISDGQVWNAIESNMKLIYRERNLSRKLKLRQEVARQFFDYVERGLQSLVEEALARGLPPQFCANAMTKLRVAFEEELARASFSARRNYGGKDTLSTEELPFFEKASRGVETEGETLGLWER